MKRLFLLCIAIWIAACSLRKGDSQTPPPSNLPGSVLAKTYCGNCHQFPEPSLLDKRTWKARILPEMGYRLGISHNTYTPFMGINYEDLSTVIGAGVYAENPMLAQEDWQKIIDYYLKEAPEKPIPQAKKDKVQIDLPLFSVQKHSLHPATMPLVTLVKFDSQQQLWIGTRTKQLCRLDEKMQIQDSLRLDSPPSDFRLGSDQKPYVLTMGIMDPNDQPKGSLGIFNQQKQVQPLLSKLQRPVEMSFGDLNQDGQEDIVVCNYGNYVGKLAWYEKKGEKYEEHLLKQLPGARRAIIQDMNQDNRPDLIVLMAQGDESVSIFFNEGKNDFEERQILRFPPVYGSSYIEVIDFDKDGDFDLLYTNGDNADYSIIPKAYHGVRLFLNDGQNRFTEAWHYPLYGASMVKVADFDGDGDYDLAVTAFHREAELAPNEGFVYFRNDGNLKFSPMTFSESSRGRWLTMDIGDYDHDGDTDIVLGSFLLTGLGKIPTEPNYHPAEIVVLKNHFKE